MSENLSAGRTPPLGKRPNPAQPAAGIPAIVSAAELCELLAVSDNRGRDLAHRGVFVKVDRNRFDTRASLRAFSVDLQTTAKRGNAGSELDREKVRVQKATAEKLELQNAEARRELVPAAEVEKQWANVLRDVRAAMLALPSRIQQRLGHLSPHDLTTMDREIRDALAEIANAD